jgi:hypothetical protein
MDNETADDIKRHLDVVAEGLRSEIRAVDEKASRRFDAVDQRFDELKRHFDVVGESLRGDIRLVAEGLVGAGERSAREFERVREEIGEVKSLLRVSYQNLDRRVRKLERKPS